MNINDNLNKYTSPIISEILNGSANALVIVNRDDLIAFANTLASIQQEPKSLPLEKAEIEKPISQEEAVKFFGKTRQTLINWRKKGVIKAYKVCGRIYYKPSELLEALEKLS